MRVTSLWTGSCSADSLFFGVWSKKTNDRLLTNIICQQFFMTFFRQGIGSGIAHRATAPTGSIAIAYSCFASILKYI